MRTKFNLPEGTEISLLDEEGAEVDEEVLPFLLDKADIPNLIFVVKGEEYCAASHNVVTPQSSSQIFPGNYWSQLILINCKLLIFLVKMWRYPHVHSQPEDRSAIHLNR